MTTVATCNACRTPLAACRTAQTPLCFSSPQIKVLVDATHDKTKVSVVSGGGSGHEPFVAGYVGCGMLTAGVWERYLASQRYM